MVQDIKSKNLKATDELSKLLNEYSSKSQLSGVLSDDEKEQILAKQEEARRANVLSGLANAAGLFAGSSSGQQFKGLGDPLEKSGDLALQEAKTIASNPKIRAKQVIDEYKAKKDALVAQQRDESQQRALDDRQEQFSQGEQNKTNRMKTIIANRTILDPYTGEVKTYKDYFGNPTNPTGPTIQQQEVQANQPEGSPGSETSTSPKKTLRLQQVENQQLDDMTTKYSKAGIPTLISGIETTVPLLEKYGVDLNNKKTFTNSVPGLAPIERALPQGIMNVTDKLGITKPEISQDAIDLRQGMQQARDFMLKQQSGGAVPLPEERRFLEQVGAGKFDDTRALISGYKSILERIKSEAKNIEAKPQNIKDVFKERTGQELASKRLETLEKSKEKTPPKSEKIKIQTPDGKTLLIPKENIEAAKKRVPGLKIL